MFVIIFDAFKKKFSDQKQQQRVKLLALYMTSHNPLVRSHA